MPAKHEASPIQRRGALEILAERASQVRLTTLILPYPESEVKGFVIQNNLSETPLTVDDKTFRTGFLVAILRQDPNTQQYMLEFRIYESVRRLSEQGAQDVMILPRDLIGKQEGLYRQEGLYAKATRESQQTILRLTAAAIQTRKSG